MRLLFRHTCHVSIGLGYRPDCPRCLCFFEGASQCNSAPSRRLNLPSILIHTTARANATKRQFFSKGHHSTMSSSTSSSYAAGEEALPHGHSDVEQIQTKNNMGFDMGKPSHRAEAWWEAYDPDQPEVRRKGRRGGGREGKGWKKGREKSEEEKEARIAVLMYVGCGRPSLYGGKEGEGRKETRKVDCLPHVEVSFEVTQLNT